MIILTAGHTGPNSGAQCAETHFDEGAENIWLRNRIAEILTNKYGLVVLVDDDRATLKLLMRELNQTGRQDDVFDRPLCPTDSNSVEIAHTRHSSSELGSALVYSQFSPNLGEELDSLTALKTVPLSQGDELTLAARAESKLDCTMPCKEEEGEANSSARRGYVNSQFSTLNSQFLIDIHFNAHSNPQARGAETIVADDATTLELRFASRLAHTTADALDIPLRSIKSESETPHRRLGMLHLTPQSIILEVCFCTSPEDVEAYRKNRERLAEELARNIALLLDMI